MLQLISEHDAEALVTLEDAIAAIEQVMADYDAGDAVVFPVATGHGSNTANGFAIKSGLIASRGLLGCKIGTYWPGNRDSGDPAHASTVVVLDDLTGYPRAIVAASYLTSLRTAAADAVAVKHLARGDARVLGVIGAGHQAYYDARAVSLVREFDEIRVWSRSPASADQMATALQAAGLPARSESLDNTAAADVVLTVTPASTPLLRRDQIRPGTHISAMGADARGKQELDPTIARDALCFADVIEQAVSIGELEGAFAQGLIRREDIRTMGSVVRGVATGRQSDDDITLFDSSGMALQDLAMAGLAMTRMGQDAGMELPW